MAYGLETKAAAESKVAELRQREPENRFEVEPHSWLARMSTRMSDGSINEQAAETWGVVRYVPYCKQMPWRCQGFVWFSGGGPDEQNVRTVVRNSCNQLQGPLDKRSI